MKATGMVRRLDDLGRLCLPAELRRALGISKRDCVEFYADGDRLVVKKYDVAGDLEQILDNAERGIREQEAVASETAAALLAKMEEMKAIVAKKREREEMQDHG